MNLLQFKKQNWTVPVSPEKTLPKLLKWLLPYFVKLVNNLNKYIPKSIEKETFIPKVINIDKCKIENIVLYHYNKSYQHTGKRPTKLLLGYKQNCELFGFVAETYYMIPEGSTLDNFYGMEIMYLPWVEDLLLCIP